MRLDICEKFLFATFFKKAPDDVKKQTILFFEHLKEDPQRTLSSQILSLPDKNNGELLIGILMGISLLYNGDDQELIDFLKQQQSANA